MHRSNNVYKWKPFRSVNQVVVGLWYDRTTDLSLEEELLWIMDWILPRSNALKTPVFVHSIKSTGAQNNIGPNWLLLHGQKTLNLFFFVAQKKESHTGGITSGCENDNDIFIYRRTMPISYISKTFHFVVYITYCFFSHCNLVFYFSWRGTPLRAYCS